MLTGKAELMAKQSGMKLGAVKNVYENSNQNPMPLAYTNAKLDLSNSASGGVAISSPEIQTGQNEIKVDVTLTYAIK